MSKKKKHNKKISDFSRDVQSKIIDILNTALFSIHETITITCVDVKNGFLAFNYEPTLTANISRDDASKMTLKFIELFVEKQENDGASILLNPYPLILSDQGHGVIGISYATDKQLLG